MKSNSKNAIQLKFVLVDGMTINFDSDCINESNSSFDNNSNDDENTIESKLKKLKIVTFGKNKKSDIFPTKIIKNKNFTKIFLKVNNQKNTI